MEAFGRGVHHVGTRLDGQLNDPFWQPGRQQARQRTLRSRPTTALAAPPARWALDEVRGRVHPRRTSSDACHLAVKRAGNRAALPALLPTFRAVAGSKQCRRNKGVLYIERRHRSSVPSPESVAGSLHS